MLKVLPHLTARKRTRVTELQRKLSSRNAVGGSLIASTTLAAGASSDQTLKQELDDLVASECVFCGDAMIRLVSRDVVWLVLDCHIDAIKDAMNSFHPRYLCVCVGGASVRFYANFFHQVQSIFQISKL